MSFFSPTEWIQSTKYKTCHVWNPACTWHKAVPWDPTINDNWYSTRRIWPQKEHSKWIAYAANLFAILWPLHYLGSLLLFSERQQKHFNLNIVSFLFFFIKSKLTGNTLFSCAWVVNLTMLWLTLPQTPSRWDPESRWFHNTYFETAPSCHQRSSRLLWWFQNWPHEQSHKLCLLKSS